MPTPQLRNTPARTVPLVAVVAVLAVTSVLASAIAVIGFWWLTKPSTPPGALAATSPASSPQASKTAAAGTKASSRLIVNRPRRLIGGDRGRRLRAGSAVTVPLPGTTSRTTAALLQVSVRDAAGPGPVTLHSTVEDLPVLRLAKAGAQTSATVVTVLGPDRKLRIATEGGGRLTVDLIGTFRSSGPTSAGRIVTVPPAPVLRLLPGVDGNRAVLDVARFRSLRQARVGAGGVSAVMFRVAGEVGRHGGLMAVGPAADRLEQQIFWGATTPGKDQLRNGFVVVPLTSTRLHLFYHAGTELRLEIVGYVTGRKAPAGTRGLAVPVPYRAAPSGRVRPRVAPRCSSSARTAWPASRSATWPLP